MSMAADFGLDDTDGPDRDDDFWYEEENVLIAEVTHACCGRQQSYFNCGEEDVPGPEMMCRDCLPTGDTPESEADFTDPFAEPDEALPFDPFRPLSLLRQLESGQWVRIGRDQDGQRLVQDLFGRPLPTCAECGMCAAEWAVETARGGNPAVPCCDAE